MYTSVEQLKKDIEVFKKELASKFDGTDGKKYLQLCGGTGCLAANTMGIKEKFDELIEKNGMQDKVECRVSGCFGLCSEGPFVRVFPDDTLYRLVKVEDCEEIFEKDVIGGEMVDRLVFHDAEGKAAPCMHDHPFYKKQKRIALHGCNEIISTDFREALAVGGYQGFLNALEMKPEDVVQTVFDSGLRGRGGGGFPTGLKWKFALGSESDEKYVVCNGDEGDPGAFMDRSALEDNPMGVIEGMMIAGYAIGADQGYFYIRAEYPRAVEHVRSMIATMEEQGLLGDNILGSGFSFHAHVRLGAGAFVCGEETALLNSIMGKRGMPRPRPPFPAVSGLWQKPTVLNNVETLATVPFILREGVEEFRKYGTEKSPGTKVFCLGGKVNNIGLVEISMGTTLRELIFEIGGGIKDGKKFKAIQTGGPSGGCLTEESLDEGIDFDNMVRLGSMMGSGGAIVMDEDNCMVDVAKFYMGFICDESCGKCSPCRIGTKRILEILNRITSGQGTMNDFDELEQIAAACKTNSLCALGQTAANPILSTMSHFKDEYIAHIEEKRCPAGVCADLVTYKIDPETCKKCSKCSRICPVEAIHGTPGKTPFEIDQAACIKCGSCLASCPFGCITKE
ncbi:MAG: SLBB domain-containing protein [Lachnospiraceae bacterium]|nr:SLBB domain-containing protein [Lachnospiraceae bacterium]